MRQPTYETNRDKFFAMLMSDPRLLARVLARKMYAALMPVPKVPAVRSINGVLMDFDFDLRLLDDAEHEFARQSLRAKYYESYEVLTTETMRRYLPESSVFVDVGASIGYLTAMGAGMVGTTGQVHSFEPVPHYARSVHRIAELNPEYAIYVNTAAVGEHDGSASIAIDKNILSGNSLVQASKAEHSIEVDVVSLSSYFLQRDLAEVDLIHVEVEGYELPVLRGLRSFLSATRRLPTIICAVFPHYYPDNGYSLEEVGEFVADYPYRVSKLSRPGAPIEIASLTAHSLLLLEPT